MTIRFRKHAQKLVPTSNVNSLKQACAEFGRQDLYKPLSRVLSLNIRWLDTNIQPFLKKGRYAIAANVMLYESKTRLAREYFEKARGVTRARSQIRRDLTTVLANLDTVSKIARRSWTLSGKYQPKQTKQQNESLGAAASKTVPRVGDTAFTKILVAVDGSKSATKAAKTAVKLAKRNAANLIVVSVIQRPSYLFAPVSGGVSPMAFGDYYSYAKKDAEKWVNEVVALAEGRGIAVRGLVPKGSHSVVQSITDYAKAQDVDLIVLGTRGLGGFDRLLLGSVSNGVVTHAHCSVLVVR
jgi:nucleotide-binding universal stress UspA family protein